MELIQVLKVFHRGEAVAKGRAKKKFGQAKSFTPTKTKHAEKNFGDLVFEAMNEGEPIGREVPLAVEIIVVRPRPASASKRQLFPIARPDLDNYYKLYLDAMNEIVYMDDSNVVNLSGWKVFGPIPGVWLRVCIVVGTPIDFEEARDLALRG